MRHQLQLTLLLIALCVLTGCSDNGPAVGHVSGEITLDDKPLSGAMVLYSPVTPGRSSLAVTDQEGKYELTFSGTQQGAVVGEHTVKITTGQDASYDDRGAVVNAAVKERVPKEYNSETTQRVSVEAGANQIDFHIQSAQ
ncbi:MAG: carboxypeptidase regulatory-like domain-containing protein [Blastopirellula sp. JB062]